MPAGKFFAYAAEVLKVQPPHLTDQPIVALMRRIGLGPGKSFDKAEVDGIRSRPPAHSHRDPIGSRWAGRRAWPASGAGVSRPWLDDPEHGTTLKRIGMPSHLSCRIRSCVPC
jgi:hypothetical protein